MLKKSWLAVQVSFCKAQKLYADVVILQCVLIARSLNCYVILYKIIEMYTFMHHLWLDICSYVATDVDDADSVGQNT